MTGSLDNTVKLWDLKSEINNKIIGNHLKGVRTVDISKDDTFAVSGCEGNQIILWDLKGFKNK